MLGIYRKVEQAKMTAQRPDFQTVESVQDKMADLESRKFALAKEANELENEASSLEHEIALLKKRNALLDENLESMDSKYESV